MSDGFQKAIEGWNKRYGLEAVSDVPDRIKSKVAIAQLINGMQDNDYESSLLIADAILDEVPPTREQIMADPRVQALVETLEGLLSITISTMVESERSIECGEEDAFRMGEWFDEADHALVMTARTALAALAALTDNEGDTE